MSSRILAIDTTGDYGSIALGPEEVLLHAPGGFSGVIFEHIQNLLDRAGMRLSDIDVFAAAAGPGSFTGVRVGLACVKGLAEATAKKAVAVSNLAALATFGSAALRVPIIDARRGEVYAAMYDASGTAIVPETVCRFSVLVKRLPSSAFEFICRNFAPFQDFLTGTPLARYPVIEAPPAMTAAVARLAGQRLDAGDPGDPAALDANYVRRSDAELLFKPW